MKIPVETLDLTDQELATNLGRFYYVLKELYPDSEYNISELASRLQKEQSNTSKRMSHLEKLGLVKSREEKRRGRPFKYMKLSAPVKRVIDALVEASKVAKLEPWQPHPGEVELCIEALKAKETEESETAFLVELGAILNSGYWDIKTENFFIEVLDEPESFQGEIVKLLRADPKKPESIEVFFKRERGRIYDLVYLPHSEKNDNISNVAFRVFVDVSERDEILDKMEAALRGDEAEKLLVAVQSYGRSLYKRLGLHFKLFLRTALKHEKKPVRSLALKIMNEISQSTF